MVSCCEFSFREECRLTKLATSAFMRVLPKRVGGPCSLDAEDEDEDDRDDGRRPADARLKGCIFTMLSW